MSVYRCPDNPIITPADVRPSRDDFEVVGVFNAGVCRFKNDVLLLLRVAERPLSKNDNIVLVLVYDVTEEKIVLREFSKADPANDFSDPRLIIRPGETYLTSMSHLRLARSKDGISFEIADSPSFAASNEYEAFGIEDPRITFIDGLYYINYVAVSPLGVTTCLASTKDFSSFERHGVMFCPDNKDIVIFPEKIDGKYYALHRPSSGLFKKNEIWIAQSPDLLSWGNHCYLMGVAPGRWDSKRIGASAVPFRTNYGWLEVYHGANQDNRYCLGAILTDLDEPGKLLARTRVPILEPQTPYELEGFFGNVVFTCGLLFEDQKLKIYYGVADTSVCYAELPLKDVLKSMGL